MFKWLQLWKARRIEDAVQREKEIATLNKEPWVKIIDTKFEDMNNPGSGYFEVDWNEYFINQLTEAGYHGRTEDDIVNMWLTDLCRGIAQDELL